MRLTIILILIFIPFFTFSQKWIGKYHDFFGHEIEFHKDFTFKYEYRFDLIHTWAVGKWTADKSVIYLNFANYKVYDTLVRANLPDSLIESRDEIPNKVNEEFFGMYVLSSGGQSSEGITDQLKIKRNRLYLVDIKGNVIHGRRRGFWAEKKWWGYKTWPLYYVKVR